MKYLLIDTNMYIDMVVARNQSHKPDSYNHMKQLLDYGEIRVIVPKIVTTEVRRHLNSEIEKVEQSLKNIDKNIKNLYWINHVDEIKLFNESFAPMKNGVIELIKEFNKNKSQYQNEFSKLFNNLFKHKNVILIEETPEIMFKANQRMLHKYKPFHYNSDKDSLADAVIIETLINIKNYINLNKGDCIYFLTRNTEDFSSSKSEKELLHSDIRTSLNDKGMSENVFYRIHFTKTLLEDFTTETDHAGFLEQLELEAKREIKEELNFNKTEENRSAGGLSSLNADWEMKVRELPEIESLIDFVNCWNEKIINKYEDFSESYFDLINDIQDKDLLQSQNMINNYNLFSSNTFDIRHLNLVEDIHEAILDLINQTVLVNPEDFDSESMWKSLDYFSIDETIFTFKTFDRKEYYLNVEGDLNPSDGENDQLLINLIESSGQNLLSSGIVDIMYGYLNFDEDGNAADGLTEDIDTHLDDLKDSIESVCENIYQNIETELLKVLDIRKRFGQ